MACIDQDRRSSGSSFGEPENQPFQVRCIADLFKCSHSQARADPDYSTDADGDYCGPYLSYHPPYCSCRDDEGNLRKSDMRRLFWRKVPKPDVPRFEIICVVFKSEVPEKEDRSSAVGIAWTQFRKAIFDHDGEQVDLRSVRYKGKERRVDLYIDWMSAAANDTFYQSPEFVEARGALAPFLKRDIICKRKRSRPFKTRASEKCVVEVVDFKLSKSITDRERDQFEFHLRHFSELFDCAPMMRQPVYMAFEGWYDCNDRTYCCSGNGGSNIFRVTFWWHDVARRPEWLNTYVKAPYMIAGHRAQLVRSWASNVSSQQLRIERVWRSDLIDFPKERSWEEMGL